MRLWDELSVRVMVRVRVVFMVVRRVAFRGEESCF